MPLSLLRPTAVKLTVPGVNSRGPAGAIAVFGQTRDRAYEKSLLLSPLRENPRYLRKYREFCRFSGRNWLDTLDNCLSFLQSSGPSTNAQTPEQGIIREAQMRVTRLRPLYRACIEFLQPTGRSISDRSRLAELFATDKPDGDDPVGRRTHGHCCVGVQPPRNSGLSEVSRPAHYPCASGPVPVKFRCAASTHARESPSTGRMGGPLPGGSHRLGPRRRKPCP